MELAGCGTEWPCCGGTGTESYMNLAAALWLGINDGYNPMPPLMTDSLAEAVKLKASETRVGLPTGRLYEMTSFEEVKEAFKKQLEYFVKWHHMNINSFEYVARGNAAAARRLRDDGRLHGKGLGTSWSAGPNTTPPATPASASAT